ncbi:three-helix bundle dimerization domain-containing protein, partial [Corynebacterium appendicis]|uniref:three-helix bundle dimerization domain-containing protein n=1 Tax=Corynebacterium appendicis TaxID=163202 RepID=UPI003C6CAD43
MIAINNISKDLHARFDEELGAHVVETIFSDTVSEHLQRANVTDWVPVLAGRDAA